MKPLKRTVRLPLITLFPEFVCVEKNSVPMALQAAYETHVAWNTAQFPGLLASGCSRKRVGWVENEINRVVGHPRKSRPIPFDVLQSSVDRRWLRQNLPFVIT